MIKQTFKTAKQVVAGATAALAVFGATAVKADPAAPPSVIGGSVICNNCGVDGSVSANGINGVTALSSNIGMANVNNTYGGFGQVTSTTQAANMDLLAGIIADNYTFRGNVGASAATNSVLSQSNLGGYNLNDTVGQVDKLTVNGTGGTVTNQAIVQLSDGQVPKGDVYAAGAVGSVLGDSNAGLGNVTNGFGGYTSGDVNLKTVNPMSSGNIFLTDNRIEGGNVSATSSVNSLLSSSNLGDNNGARSVGPVQKWTFANSPAP